MEASVAGQAQGGDGQQGGGEAEAQQQGPDLAALASQMEQFAGGQEELRNSLQALQQALPPQEAEQPQADEPLDLSFLDDPGVDPEAQQEALRNAFAQVAQQTAEQATAPLREQITDLKLQRDAQALVDEFPEFADPEVAQGVLKASEDYAQLLGQPDLAGQPAFWRIMFAAGRAFDQSKTEGDQPDAAHLEGGSGAQPGGSGEDHADLIKQIIGARGGGLDFT